MIEVFTVLLVPFVVALLCGFTAYDWQTWAIFACSLIGYLAGAKWAEPKGGKKGSWKEG